MYTKKVITIIFTFCVWSTNAQIAINSTGDFPDSSAALDINFNNKGVLLPRITTAERDLIINPAHSLIIFNRTVNCYQGYNALSGIWENIYCFQCSSTQQKPIATSETNVTITSFTANWSAVSNATAYFLDVATDSNFTNILPSYNNLSVGNILSYNITNLVCGVNYYYRVRSLGNCGISDYSNTKAVNISCGVPSCFSIGGANEDRSSSMVKTPEGELYIAGWTSSFGAGAEDIYIIKIDTTNNIKWIKTFGGSNYDYAYDLCLTPDNNIIVLGTTASFGSGNADIFIAKIDPLGNVLWAKTIGGNNSDYGRSITSTLDGGYAITGYTNSFGNGGFDVFIIKLNADGTIQWSKTVGGSHDDFAYSIIQTSNQDYITVGKTYSFGSGLTDIYAIKLDANGNLLWAKTIGGSSNEIAYSITQASDNGYLIAGWTSSFGAGSSDVYIIKIDDFGNIQWTKTIGGANEDGGSRIIQTSDGGYAVTGGTKSYGAGDNDIYFIKLDLNGNVEWIKTIGGNGSEGAASVVQITNSLYCFAGITSSLGMGSYDIYFIKTDANGSSCCSFNASGDVNFGGYSSSGGTLGNPSFNENNINNIEINSGGTKKTHCP